MTGQISIFFLPFVLLSFCLQEKPISRFKAPSNASQIRRLNAAFLSTWQPVMDGLGLFNRRKRFCEMLLRFRRHQALFETIIDFAIISLNVVKTHIHATRTTCFKYTNLTIWEALVLVAQSVRRWVGTQPLINSAGLMPCEAFFLHLTTRLGRLFGPA